MDIPNRKSLRLENYDYSSNSCYFITICTKDRKPLLWSVGASLARPQEIELSPFGEAINHAITRIPIVGVMMNTTSNFDIT